VAFQILLAPEAGAGEVKAAIEDPQWPALRNLCMQGFGGD
jgi:hypothetical protein